MYSLISLETSQPEIWKTQTKKQIYNQFKKANKQTKTKQKTTTNSSCAFGSISFCLPRYNCYYSVLFLLITVYEHLSIFWEEKWITKEEVWKSTGNTFIIVANTPLLKLQKKKGDRGLPWGPLGAQGFYTTLVQEVLCNCTAGWILVVPPTATCTLSVTAAFWYIGHFGVQFNVFEKIFLPIYPSIHLFINISAHLWIPMKLLNFTFGEKCDMVLQSI